MQQNNVNLCTPQLQREQQEASMVLEILTLCLKRVISVSMLTEHLQSTQKAQGGDKRKYSVHAYLFR